MSAYILLASNDSEFNDELMLHANQYEPDFEWVLPDDDRASCATVAACWFPDKDLLTRFPNIQCLHSLAAGVEHLGETLLHSSLPICRIVDEEQKVGMLEYVLWGVLYFQRDFDRAVENQKRNHWQRYPQKKVEEITIGIMGLGEIGGYVANGLANQGYKVSGWSRTAKSFDNIQCFSGNSGLDRFLENTQIVVNLLPLNDSTYRLINESFLDKLPDDATLINCGRGGHICYQDLCNALSRGTLRGAILDVFDDEPLQESNALWHTPNVLITPHMASASSSQVLVKQVIDNTQRFVEGRDLINTVGYAD
ncbi:glyoxylate/hydroxypyruvate reductase A [Marinomonas mediterranea]|uniref:2-hydroxyacid dehydrogenase n=1 Tax=Marinomonas mediterranea TaxID=119864 RepID=UPI002349A36A|nr:glyoxylate/hydroxypyruvate reductase A [Marinomonas mediterranea]WCN13955.1 glyoxylate/hydroxypyruvate reductase A [Marinomonas mediterranea]